MSFAPSSLLAIHALLFGSMVFFAVVVAPSVFRFVPEREAGMFLRGMFPHYYLWGAAISLIMSAIALLVSPVLLVSSTTLLVLFLIARQVLMPAINRSRDQAKAGDAVAKNRFNALHRASVAVNAAQMLILLSVMIYLVNLA